MKLYIMIFIILGTFLFAITYKKIIKIRDGYTFISPKISNNYPEHFKINSKIATYETNIESKKLIIFCHGNASDLTMCKPFCDKLSQLLKIKAVSFDYRGYGTSVGKPDEDSCYDDLATVVNYYKNYDIILIGHSLGTGVVVGASYKYKWKYPIVLIAPFKYIIKVVFDKINLFPIDAFNNESKIKKLKSDILILHGKMDTVINIIHSQVLFNKIKNNKKYNHQYEELNNCDHDNILNQNVIKLIKKYFNFA